MRREAVLGHLRWPPPVWLVGVGGLFGYHVLYFLALRTAPAVEASLINYLWPLLIVVFSALLPGHRLRWWHLAGAVSGLAGTVILVGYGGGEGFGFRGQYLTGYLAALCRRPDLGRLLDPQPPLRPRTDRCRRRLLRRDRPARRARPHSPSRKPYGPRAASGWPLPPWASGPSGSPSSPGTTASSTATSACSGVAAYATPLLSTLLLIAAGQARLTWALAVACVLIVGGAILAAREMIAAPQV